MFLKKESNFSSMNFFAFTYLSDVTEVIHEDSQPLLLIIFSCRERFISATQILIQISEILERSEFLNVLTMFEI